MSDHGHGHAPSHAPEPAHHTPEPSHHAESHGHGGDSGDGGEGFLGVCSSLFCGLINIITGAVSDTVNGLIECNLVGELLDGGGGGGGGGGDHGHSHGH